MRRGSRPVGTVGVSVARLRREDGFTVLETIVAMVIISIGLMFLVATVPLLMADVVNSGQTTRATFHAEKTSEWLHGLDFADTYLTAGTHQDPEADPAFECSWTVEDNMPEAGVKRVTVISQHRNEAANRAQLVFFHAEAGR